jgi:tripartite-type tricarboxylate transporter receptor subunit TctC
LQAASAAVLAEETVRKQLATLGVDRIVGNTPAEARDYVAAEVTRWEGVLREAGISAQ